MVESRPALSASPTVQTNLGSAVIDASGTASLTISTLSAGAHAIVANYGGDGRASASLSVPLPLVVKQTAAVALATSASPAPTLSTVVLTATISNAGQTVATGNVTFSDGATQLGSAALDAGGKATLSLTTLAQGPHNIVASYAGDATNFAAQSTALLETIQLRPTTMGLTATATSTTNTQQVTLISVVRWTGPVAPTGTVTFKTGSTVMGTTQLDSAGVATLTVIVPSSSSQVTASYAGDSVYAASDSAATAISGGPATQFTLQVNPSNMTMQSKQHSTVNMTIQSIKAFSDTLQFGCLGLPFAATCTFSSTNMVLKADGTAVVQLTIDTGNPLGAGATASNAAHDRTGVMLCFLPGTLLAGFAMWRTRRRTGRSTPLTAILLMLGMAAAFSATGCEGLVQKGTPAGTYTFQVRAAGQGSGASQSQTMTLTVTE